MCVQPILLKLSLCSVLLVAFLDVQIFHVLISIRFFFSLESGFFICLVLEHFESWLFMVLSLLFDIHFGKLFSSFSFFKWFFLLSNNVGFNLILFIVFIPGFLQVFFSLEFQHLICQEVVSLAILLQLSLDVSSLFVQIIPIHILKLLLLFKLLLPQGLTHLILVLDDGTPFIIDHFLLRNW